MTHRGPFQPLLFCDSAYPQYWQWTLVRPADSPITSQLSVTWYSALAHLSAVEVPSNCKNRTQAPWFSAQICKHSWATYWIIFFLVHQLPQTWSKLIIYYYMLNIAYFKKANTVDKLKNWLVYQGWEFAGFADKKSCSYVFLRCISKSIQLEVQQHVSSSSILHKGKGFLHCHNTKA